MIARVSLEIALRREFDYLIPPELVGQVEVGSRVQVPFGARKIPGCVTALAEESAHAHLKPILKVIGAQTLVTPKVLQLARWIGEYYCCAPETALKAVLPEAVRQEEAGWRERLYVRALTVIGDLPKLPPRQQAVWNLLTERRELAMTELLALAQTTAGTVRKLEDRGLVEITAQISERDPYAREQILPSTAITLNPAQAAALAKIKTAMDERLSSASEPLAATAAAGRAPVPGALREKGAATFLLHGVTGSGKTEIYLQAIAYALEQGKGAIVLVPEIALTPQTVERFKARFSSGKLQTLVAVLHSHLSAGERHDEWHKIRQGRARIVIGARSAIFAPVEERDGDGKRHMSGGKSNTCGTPQGGVASPLLANIYMNRFLKHWRLCGRGEAFHAHVVSYADDFVILSRGRAEEALAWTKAVMTKLGLTLNEMKTSVKNAQQESFDFLGYTIGPQRYRKDGHWYLGASPSKKSVQRIKTKIGDLLKPGNMGAWPVVRHRLNQLLIGWSAYFGYGTRLQAYRAIDHHVYDRVRHFLARRHKVQGRGTRRFSRDDVYGELGVLHLRRVHIGPPS